MKKRVLALVLVLSMFLSFSSGILPTVRAENTLPTYNAQENFGAEVFSYYSRDVSNGTMTEMSYNSNANIYLHGTPANYIGPNYLSAGANPAIGSVLIFTAPYSGTITISNAVAEGLVNKGYQWDKTNYAVCYATIYSPSWSVLGSYSIPANDTPVATPDIIGITVEAGQQIKFLVGSNTALNSYINWIPVISYTEVESLEHQHQWQTEWQSDENYHWHDCTSSCDIADNAQKDGYGAHTDENADEACDSCGYAMPAENTLPVYNAQDNYGADVFSYVSRNVTNGVNTDMSFNTTHNMYMVGSTANYIAPNYLSAGANPAISSMLIFTAPYSGTITISNAVAEGIVNKGQTWDKTNYQPCYANIYAPDWSYIATYSIPANDTPVATPDITGIQVEAGQQIKFMIGSNSTMNCYINWIPVISYTVVSGETHQHQWQTEWATNETHHWHECVTGCDITEDAQKDSYGVHVDENADEACDSCGYAMPAENALPVYNSQDNYGADVFSYVSRNVTNGVNTDMSFNTTHNMYMIGSTANYIAPNFLSAGANPAISSMLIFTAPYSGTITISNAVAEGIVNKGQTWDKTNYQPCYANIYAPDWSYIATYSLPANDTPVETPDITNIQVEAGQQIKFMVGSNSTMNCYVNWIPVISYTEVESLEHQHQWQTEWQSDEGYHWHDCTSSCDITDNAQKDGYGAHTDEDSDGKCDTCSYELPQESTLPSYNANDDFGSDVFSYVSRNVTNGVNTDMSFNTTHNMYMVGSTANYIAPNFLSAGANPAISSMLIFTAPYSGTITISNAVAEGIVNKGQTWDKTNYQPCYANIYAPDWSYIATYSIPANDTPVATPDITGIQVEAGQQIKFMIGSNSTMNCYINWIPVISYTTVSGETHQHQWQTEWATNETHHWHECVTGCDITEDAQKDSYGVHVDENADEACDSCGYAMPAENALPVYNAQDNYGADVFSYVSRNVTNGVNTEMNFNTTHNFYQIGSTANYIAPNYLSVGANPAIGSMIIFTAPYTGTVTISNAVAEGIGNKGQTWDKTNYQTCYATIYGTDWSALANYALPANDTPVATPDITGIQVEAGQQIKFLVGSNSTMNCYINWIPVISYTAMGETAHVHLWQENWQFNETHHWHNCTADCDITDNAEKDGYDAHIDENNDDKCDTCGYVMSVSGDGTDLVYSFVGGYQTESADTGIWRYYVREIVTNTYTPMNYNSSTQRWEAPAAMGTAYIWQGKLHTSASATASADYMTALRFVAPYKGTVTVSFPGGLYVSAESSDGITFAFWEDQHLKQHNGLANDLIPGQALELDSYTIDVVVGQQMNFLFHRKGSNEGDTITINPTITYLEAEIEDPADRWLDEKEPVEDSAFSFAFVPDTQGIAYHYPDEMATIYDWIIDNVDEQNIQYVFGLGDITETNVTAEWELAKEQIDRLNGVVPYSVIRGNHDMRAEFNQYFSDEAYTSQFEGFYNDSPATSYRTLSVNGIDFLLITLELFAPDAELAWAAEVIEAFPNHNVIITTHGYLAKDGTQIATGTGFGKEYTDRQSDGNNGDEIWDKLVSKYENIRLVVCGHISSDDVVVTQTEGVNGNVVSQVLINYQHMDVPSHKEAPVGMVALFHISEDGQTISVETYSTIREQYFKKKNQFEFEIGFTTGGSGEEGEHTHAWKEEWAGNETHHWHNCTATCNIKDNAEKDGYAEHVDKILDGLCDICGHSVALPGANDHVYSYTDMYSGKQNGVWHYLMREAVTNTYKKMTWNGEMWEDGMGGFIAKDWMHASADASDNHEMQVCLEYVAPYDGVISVSMLGGTIRVAPDSQNGVRVAVWKNTDAILAYTDIGPGETYEFAPKKVSVDEGDCIRFLVTAIAGNNAGDATFMQPIIAYKSIEYRLGPDQGFYSSMDMFSSQQTDIWQYLKRETVSGTIEELTWDGEKWIDGMGGIIAKEWMHASADGSDKHEIQMCLSFTAPSDGVVKIGMEDNVIGVSADSQNGVRVGIMQNNNLIYTYTDLSRGRNHYFEPITVNITKGDKIYFLLMPIAGNNAGDSTTLLPCITYLSYEKAPDPVLEEVPDDPSKTYYNSTDDFGGYLNPWYYTYCALGSQKLEPMTWNAQTNTFIVSGFAGLQISAAGAHPYPGYDAVRVFRAPKSGTIRLTMNNDVISLINGTSGVEDGVFVSIRLSDGASVTEVFKKTLVLPDEELAFEPIELKIYEGWELWFVVNCNTNNASDAAQYAPIVEYLEITDEKAPVYSNREEDTNEPSLDELNPDTSKDSVGNAKNNGMNIWLIVAIFVATAVVANIILILVFKRKRKV